MKKIIAALSILTVLAIAPAARAETVTCETSQYGGAVCGAETSTETTVTHETVDAGIADWSLIEIIAFAGIVGVAATLLYKASYRWYIFG